MSIVMRYAALVAMIAALVALALLNGGCASTGERTSLRHNRKCATQMVRWEWIDRVDGASPIYTWADRPIVVCRPWFGWK